MRLAELFRDSSEKQESSPETITTVELDGMGNLVINEQPFRIRDLKAIELRHERALEGTTAKAGLVKVFLDSKDRANRQIFSNVSLQRNLVGQAMDGSEQVNLLRRHAQTIDVPVIEF